MLTTLLHCILTVVRVQVEQKARREDVLNQLLVLLNTAIHRKDREPAAGAGGRARQRRTASKMDIVMPARCVYCVTVLYCTVLYCTVSVASTETEEDEGEEGETNYMSGALGLIPTD